MSGADGAFAPDTPLPCRVLPSPNHGPRREGLPLDTLVLHYTGMESGAAALAWLRDPASEVSCHYLVHEDGGLDQLVPEARRAWHAGAGAWAGETDLNSRSVGIEVVNGGHAYPAADGALPPFPEAQVEALIALCRDVMDRRAIPPARVLAHSDLAPARKRDPGEAFPWARLAAQGIGEWVPPAASTSGRFLSLGDRGPPVAALQAMFALRGYPVPESGVYDAATAAVVAAFQRRHRPARVDGVADAGTVTTLRDLLALPRNRQV